MLTKSLRKSDEVENILHYCEMTPNPWLNREPYSTAIRLHVKYSTEFVQQKEHDPQMSVV